MTYQNYWKGRMGLVVGILLFIVAGCSDSGGNTNPTGDSGLPADPGAGNLAGIVYGTISGQPLVGVSVSAQRISTTTDTAGVFTLNGVGAGTMGVVISGNAVYLRTASVNTSKGRSVRLDAIETNSAFNLGFYREIARGNSPSEKDLFQTHRWTNSTPPTFIVNTDATYVNGGVISEAQINAAVNTLARITPVFTGGFYAAPTVKTQRITPVLMQSLDDIPNNTFLINFDDSLINQGIYGITLTQPDFTLATTSTINKAVIYVAHASQIYTEITFQEVVAHESGHGFGFRHTSNILPSVMVAVGTFGGLYGAADQLHMKVMYSRPGGNTDIDNDPVPGSKVMGQPLGVQVFIDRRGNFPKLPAEQMAQIRSLPRNPLLRQYVPEYQ